MPVKPPATRASSRTKTTSDIVPPVPSTRTTRARTATQRSTSTDVTPLVNVPAKRPVGRKPLEKRDNIDVPIATTKTKATVTKAVKQASVSLESEREPIMAYLRIRPQLNDEALTSSPYLMPLSDTSVRMTDPQDSQNNRSRYRPSTVQPSSIYTFSHVFPPNTNQSDFFTKTTLPLVKDLLQGQNGLLFTYGVTNSGKTYTVQGGSKEGAAGILPRTLDVIFNSIEGLHGDGKYRPARLYGVEPAEPTDSKPPQIAPEPVIAEVLQSLNQIPELEFDIDPTVVTVDRNYQYTIWISYAEVYNEKIYDLLASVKEESNVHVDNSAPRLANGKSLLLSRQALPLRPSPASDGADSEMSGKYIAGLRQFRIHSAAQAKSLVKLGQLHRQVFGTLANRESSRSHGMVIVKVVRGHRGEKNDPSALQISRLTLVDLAGSERTKHTHTTGDRLKEAGNINKSLMVLGQCMEVLRSNQRKLAVSLAHEGTGKNGRIDTRDVKKTLAVVPFRHSKLTESLMDYFIGDGRAVMIVNVNPYDTGYDENSHVMKFAALAREVYITPAPAPVQRVPGMLGPGRVKGHKIKEPGPLTLKDPEIAPIPIYRRKVTIPMGAADKGRKPNEAILEVLEEDEPKESEEDDGDGDNYPVNPLVDALFDEVENLRMQLFEAEMRCAVIEADTREEVMREMEERMKSMEKMYSRRLMSELEQNEIKTDEKIDMLHQAGLFASPTKKCSRVQGSLTEEEEEEGVDVEMSLVDYGPQEDEEDDNMSCLLRSPSISPLGRKEKTKSFARRSYVAPKPIIEKRKFVPDPPMVPSDTEEAILTETEDMNDTDSIAQTEETKHEEVDEDINEEDDDDYNDESEDEDDWLPPAPSSSKLAKATKPKKGEVHNQEPHHSSNHSIAKGSRMSKMTQDLGGLSLELNNPDDSVVIIPAKQFRNRQPSSGLDKDDQSDSENDEEVPVVKKKKRQLAKKPVFTVEGIEKVTWEAEKLNGYGAKTIRRLGN